MSRITTGDENNPTNPKLWEECKEKAKERYTKWPSAYAVGHALKLYKDEGGGWRKTAGKVVNPPAFAMAPDYYPSIYDSMIEWVRFAQWFGVSPIPNSKREIAQKVDAIRSKMRTSAQRVASQFLTAKAKKDVGHGGLDEWFSGHGQGKGKAPGEAQWGDWVAISPVKRTITREDGTKKTYNPGDIIGPCGSLTDDPDWKDLTQGGKTPFKCMARPKAHDMPKGERAEKAREKMKVQEKAPKGKKPVSTPTFKQSSHVKSIALMKFLSGVARSEGVAKHVYVVGGAVRNFLLGVPIKDIDVVVDSVSVGQGRDSEWFARKVADAIPVQTNLTTNQYGVAILTVKGEWVLDGVDLMGEVIEIANARKESYDGAGGKGKGYKPTDVSPATIEEDVLRREFTFNTLLFRMLDLAHGPEYAEVIDITGLGRQHLEEKLIATPVDPDKTFRDDPTRQLRILKFLLRYDLKISPDVVASVKRNAHRLKDMPWEAVGNILVGDILKSAKATTGIRVMKSLGILDVLVEMIQETPPFAAYLTKQLANGNHSVELLLELADLGIAGRVLSFLTTEQRARFKELSQGMGADESRRFLEVLRAPPVDNAALIQEFSLEGRDRGILAPLAREAILVDPSLATHEVRLNDRVREALRATRTSKVAATPEKYKHIDFKPPQSVADAAAKGLEYRGKASPSNKGGLTPSEAAEQGIGSGVQRAVNLKNRDNISPEVIKQMVAFFSRHEKNKGVSAEHRDEPWNDKGNVSWLIWGGDPGRTWAEKVKGQMEAADKTDKKAGIDIGEFPALMLNFSVMQRSRGQGSLAFSISLRRVIQNLIVIAKGYSVPTMSLQRALEFAGELPDASLKPGKFSASQHALSLAEDSDSVGDVLRNMSGVVGVVRMETIDSGFAGVFSPLSEALLAASGDFMQVGRATRVASRFMVAEALETKKWGPFTFEIDRPKGFVKTWDRPDGSVKKFKYPCDYGYFVDHTGEDEEGLDAFVGNDPQGKIESFLKMRRDDGELVPDETKFLVGLTDSEREKVLGLYDPEEIVGLREYTDFYELLAALNAFRDRKKQASMSTRRVVAEHLLSDPSVALAEEVKGLETLASEIQVVVDTFLETVPMPHVGRIAALQLRSQTECLTLCEQGARDAQRVINKAFTLLQTRPGDGAVTAAIRDAQMLLEKFHAYRVKSRQMQSAMAQKIMPRALKEIAQLTLDEIRAELYEPSRISVTVFPYLVPLLVEGSEKTGMRFDVYLTVYPSPTEVSKGLPRYQQFVLSQNTIGDTLVYLVAIDRTNVLDPTPPEVVGSQGAASKILDTYLKDWSNLLSNHTTRTAARARKVLTREGVAAMGAAEINKLLDLLDKESSGITDEMIANGRGTERPTETMRMTDPLSLRYIQNWEDASLLREEIARRYGPGAPRRLPSRGFGPIKMAAPTIIPNRGNVAKFLVSELKKLPGVKATSSMNRSLVMIPGALNPAIKFVEFTNLDQDFAPFKMVLKNGMEGWGWDGFHKPAPVFLSTNNTLKLGVVFDGKRDPAAELRAFIKNVLLIAIEKAGKVWNGKELVPMTPAKSPAAPKAMTRTDVLNFIAKKLSAPGVKVDVRDYYLLMEPGKLNPLVKNVQVICTNPTEVSLDMTLSPNDPQGRGWSWSPHSGRYLEGKKTVTITNPKTDLPKLVEEILDQTKRAGLVYDRDKKLVPLYGPAAAPKTPPPPSVPDVGQITSALKRMRLGPVGGRVESVSLDEGGANPSWTVTPTNRQRLDHYVGAGYQPEEGDDEEGWDEDGWSEDYAEPIRSAAVKWLNEEFGPNLFYVEVGEKGHVELSLTNAGRKKFGI